MKGLGKLYIFRNKWIVPYVRILLSWADGILYFMSFIFLFAGVCKYGFSLTYQAQELIDNIYQIVWVTFLIVNSMHLILDFEVIRRSYRKITWILNFLLYLTLLPVVFRDSLPAICVDFLQHSFYTTTLLVLLSLLNLSNGLVRLLGKRTNPSLILAFSFLFLILLGTGLLMLPKSTYTGISFIDALFTSTSAVCVTGLTSVDVSSVFTPKGQFVILFLIQIGGLGVMTITSFFAMFFMGNTSIYNQLVVKDMVSSQSLNSLLSTLLYILIFTLSIEAIGALFLFLDIRGTLNMSYGEELFFSVFHSISAFCNAGFSTLPNNLGNQMLMQHHSGFYLSISLLVILGGIGYPILANFYQILRYEVKRLYLKVVHRKIMVRKIHLYNLNTRIVIGMTAALLLIGTFFFLIAEWNGALSNLPVMDKLIHAFFNSVSPRTAGFNSVSLSEMGMQSLLIYMLLMVIGGGAQSTAGGVKVNAFAVVLLNLRAVLKGSQTVTVYNRTLSVDSIRRSNATLIFYMMIVFLSFLLITLCEPELSPFALLFECISALSTVGSSLDLTSQLGDTAKLLIILLMFVGRVGLLNIFSSLMRNSVEKKYQYPSDQIIIN